MNYTILSTEIHEETSTVFVATMKTATVEGETIELGIHRWSAAPDADISHMPQNVQDRITLVRAQIAAANA